MDNGSEVRELVYEGVIQREIGSLEEARKIFIRAYNIIKRENDQSQRQCLIEILNHLGLTFFHQGEIEKSKAMWKKAANLSSVYRLPSMKAASFRNLSRKELWETEHELHIAYLTSIEALRLAKESGRKDLPWFVHGCFSIANSLEKEPGKREVLKEILKEERKQLKTAWKNTPKLEKKVWFTGLLVDYGAYYDFISKPVLRVGLVIARVFKLKRREEQIEKIINEY